jgi:plasmid stabilization system protein ParE
MARYTVTWHGQAEQDLADIWLFSSDREGITAAEQRAYGLQRAKRPTTLYARTCFHATTAWTF